MTGYRQGHMEKVCRGCGRVYYRQFRRNSGREGWCGGRCYMRTYRRSLREAANGQPAGAARAGRDQPSGPLVRCQDTLEGRETVTESEEIIGFNLDLVAERPLVAQTRFAEDGGIGVDWRGRCWAWLNGDEAPALVENPSAAGTVRRRPPWVWTDGQRHRQRLSIDAKRAGRFNPPGPPVFSGPSPSSPLTACRTGGLRFVLDGRPLWCIVGSAPPRKTLTLPCGSLAQGAQGVWRSRLHDPGRGRLPSRRPGSVSNRDALFSFRGGFC